MSKSLVRKSLMKRFPCHWGSPAHIGCLPNAYKPVEVAAKLKLPIFVLQGERDYQVTMEDFGLWRSGLLRCKNAYFKSYPKLNHLLQEWQRQGDSV